MSSMLGLSYFVFVFIFLFSHGVTAQTTKLHVHLSLPPGDQASDSIIVSWRTLTRVLPTVIWGDKPDELTQAVHGQTVACVHTQPCYIHSVTLTGLRPSRVPYFYAVKADWKDYSKVYSFRSRPNEKQNLRVCVIGKQSDVASFCSSVRFLVLASHALWLIHMMRVFGL
jgi:hypothetical protein